MYYEPLLLYKHDTSEIESQRCNIELVHQKDGLFLLLFNLHAKAVFEKALDDNNTRYADKSSNITNTKFHERKLQIIRLHHEGAQTMKYYCDYWS